jgi:hypothetical protein
VRSSTKQQDEKDTQPAEAFSGLTNRLTQSPLHLLLSFFGLSLFLWTPCPLAQQKRARHPRPFRHISLLLPGNGSRALTSLSDWQWVGWQAKVSALIARLRSCPPWHSPFSFHLPISRLFSLVLLLSARHAHLHTAAKQRTRTALNTNIALFEKPMP